MTMIKNLYKHNNSLAIKMGQIKVVLILLIVIITNIQSASVRIFFSRCGSAGFTCFTDAGNYHITYICPPGTEDVTFYLWHFRSPSNTVEVTIQKCKTLRFSFECAGDNRPIKQLSITNITNLLIIPTVLAHNPPTVHFENIDNLEYIPTKTFSQIKQQTYKPGCFNPVGDFENLLFKNISIGTIAPKAFGNLKNFQNFTWQQVHVKRLQYSSINIQLNTIGDFRIDQCSIEICEHLAFQLISKRAIFVDNKFSELSTSSINGTIESFKFITNKVTTLLSSAISILSKDVSISNNNFEYLHAGAFQNISPGLLQDSQRNFGTLRFSYEFSLNNLRNIEAGSLNPDIIAYNNVATNLKFTRNIFHCTCENFGWLFVDVGHGYKSKALKDFYATIIDKQYKNTCAFTSCELPINQIQLLVYNGKCVSNITADSLCVESQSTEETTTSKSRKINVQSDRITGRFFFKNTGSRFTKFNVVIFVNLCIFQMLLF